MNEFDILRIAPLLQLLAVAVLTDWRGRSIPNGITLGGAAFGLILVATLLGPAGAFQSIAGWTLCLLVFLPFYATGGMAGGDVKLIAMVGAFLGPVHGLLACFATLTVGALIGLLCIIYQQLAQRMAGANKADAIALQQQLQSKIPYAGAIAAGTALAVVGAYSFLPAAA